MLPQSARKKGFTLVEIVIVVGILMILFVIVTRGALDTTSQLKFNNILQEISNAIRSARADALTGVSVSDFTDFDEDKTYGLLPDGTCPGPSAEACKENDQVGAAGIGLLFDTSNLTIDYLIDLHNKSEGELVKNEEDASLAYTQTADLINTAKSLDFSIAGYEEYAFLLSTTASNETTKRQIIYTPPYGDVLLSDTSDEKLMIWVYKISEGYEKSGKIISINKVSGIPEIIDPADLPNAADLFDTSQAKKPTQPAPPAQPAKPKRPTDDPNRPEGDDEDGGTRL